MTARVLPGSDRSRYPVHVDLDYADLEIGIQPGEQTTGIRRILRIGLGVVLVLAGVAMLVLPGQGVLTILIGLNLIKPDNPVVRWIRARTPGVPEEGPIPVGMIVVGAVLFVAFGVVSVLYGPEIFAWARSFVA